MRPITCPLIYDSSVCYLRQSCETMALPRTLTRSSRSWKANGHCVSYDFQVVKSPQ